ncbi:MAG TPA: hypothetical protein VL576_00400 [Candidatus Paceibacterota bacterium]|jgi:hypothetical protein|nr:hypothetical protein [Candidatus Paceibacterota bacterium]
MKSTTTFDLGILNEIWSDVHSVLINSYGVIKGLPMPTLSQPGEKSATFVATFSKSTGVRKVRDYIIPLDAKLKEKFQRNFSCSADGLKIKICMREEYLIRNNQRMNGRLAS